MMMTSQYPELATRGEGVFKPSLEFSKIQNTSTVSTTLLGKSAPPMPNKKNYS